MTDGGSRLCLEIGTLGHSITANDIAVDDNLASSSACEGTESDNGIVILVAQDYLASTIGITADDRGLGKVELKRIGTGVIVCALRISSAIVNPGRWCAIVLSPAGWCRWMNGRNSWCSPVGWLIADGR